jgi:glycosyltransferase involved in cell wall biosynthesis
VVTRVALFRPTLGQGGADRVTLTLLQALDRSRFAPTLVLVRAEGPFLADVPADVPVVELGARRLAASVGPLARFLRADRPDVLFSTAGASNLIAIAAHRVAGSRARLVLSERNALYRGRRLDPKQNLEVVLKRVCYRRADLVTTVSRGVADQLAGSIVARDRLRVVFNPMLGDDLAARAAEPVDDPGFVGDEPVVVACGRLVDQKDYPTLLAAFAEIRRRRPARLFVLGEGPLRPALEARARRLGLADADR